MKFGQTLSYNAVPEWHGHYMAYDVCKHMLESIRMLQLRLFYAKHPSDVQDGRLVHDADSSDDEPDPESATRPQKSFRLGRSASHAVLQELASSQFEIHPGDDNLETARRGSVSQSSHRHATEADNSDVASNIRTLKDQLDVARKAFLDRLDAEANRVDTFYSAMLIHLPQYSFHYKQRIAQLLDTSVPLPPASEWHDPHEAIFSNLDLANDRTPLLEGATMLESSPRYRGADSGIVSPVLRPSPQAPGLSQTPPHERLDPREAELLYLRTRICSHYVDIVGMINFSVLNTTAFDKILKKYDKITGESERATRMDNLRKTKTFTDHAVVDSLRDEVDALFADTYYNGDQHAAKEELHEGVREQVLWKRNTVWRDMLRNERRVSALRAAPGVSVASLETGDMNKNLFAIKRLPFLVATFAFFLVLSVPGIMELFRVPDGPVYKSHVLAAAHRCLALLVFVVILWAQDGLPLYVTGFLVLPGTVILRILLDSSGSPMKPSEAAQEVFRSMGSSTIMLIICVYTLHAALSKYGLDKQLASEVLSQIDGAHWLLLAVMILAVMLSMLVSNVASPVLLNSLVSPVLMEMPRFARPFVQCVLLGIAVASNIGGMPSPISSPQNAVALSLLKGKNEVSFVKWLAVALPLSLLMILCTFVVLLVLYKPYRYRLPHIPRHREKLFWPHYVVICTTCLTVALWISHSASKAFGSAGMVAVLPLVVFYGTGILDKEDFNNLPWDVVYLVVGGVVLGNGVRSSELLKIIANWLHYGLGNAPLWVTYVVFSTFMAVVANMVSHTVSAIIVLPVVAEVGEALGHPRLLVMGGVLACSSAMSLPVSSFPNMAALSVTTELGESFLSSMDLLKVGVPMTAICTGIVLTVGFVWMRAFKF